MKRFRKCMLDGRLDSDNDRTIAVVALSTERIYSS